MISKNNSALAIRYKDQLGQRFFSNSTAVTVLIGLAMVGLLVIQIIKLVKKTYQWQTDHELYIQGRYQQVITDIDNQQNQKKKSKKPEIPTAVRAQQKISLKILQVSILVVNVIMMSSYEYVSISAYIATVIMIISQILSLRQTQHLNLRFVLDVLSKLLILSWFITLFAVAKPSPK